MIPPPPPGPKRWMIEHARKRALKLLRSCPSVCPSSLRQVETPTYAVDFPRKFLIAKLAADQLGRVRRAVARGDHRDVVSCPPRGRRREEPSKSAYRRHAGIAISPRGIIQNQFPERDRCAYDIFAGFDGSSFAPPSLVRANHILARRCAAARLCDPRMKRSRGDVAARDAQ